MDITDRLIELRILLNSLCDGFSQEDLSKDMTLSTKTKILFCLSQDDLGPGDIINKIGIAKSNLANIIKVMIKDGLVDSYKNVSNSKNVYYKLTENGQRKLKEYKDKLFDNISSDAEWCERLSEGLQKVIQIIKGKEDD